MQVQLANVRIDMAHLFTQHTTQNADGTTTSAYKARFIIEPDSPNDAALKAAIVAVAKEKWGANFAPVLETIVGDKMCRRKGDANLDKQNAIRVGYAGKIYLATSSKMTRPTVVGPDRAPLVETDNKIYNGCRVNAIVDVYASDKPGFGKGIFCGLGGVQFWADDERLAGSAAPVAADEFASFGAAPAAAVDKGFF